MRQRVLILVVTVAIVFGVTVAVLLRVLPGPHGDTDYLVIGALGTLAGLSALFIVLITGAFRSPDVFYKRRQRPKADDGSSRHS